MSNFEELERCLEALEEEVQKTEKDNEHLKMPSILKLDEAAKITCSNEQHQVAANVLQIREFGSRVWNAAIKLSRTIGDRAIEGDDTLRTIARLKQMACELLVFADPPALPRETLLVVRLYTRAGKSWKDAGNNSMAETCFAAAALYWDILENQLKPEEVHRPEQLEVLFETLYIRADVSWQRDRRDDAFQLVAQAKEKLRHLPSEASTFAVLCYNCGLACFRAGSHPESVRWLQQSLELYDMDPQADKGHHSRTARLLANAFIQSGNPLQSLTCLELANNLQDHVAGLYLLIKLQLSVQRVEDAEATVERLISHAGVTVEAALAAVELFSESKHYSAAANSCFLLLQRKLNTSEENLQVKFRWLQLLLMPEVAGYLKAVEILESVIAEHTGETNRIPTALLTSFSSLVWNTACDFFEKKDFEKSAEWYKRGVQLLPPDDVIRQATGLRLLGFCFFNLKNFSEALRAATRAAELDADSLKTQFLLFKIHLERADEAEAVSVLDKMSETPSFDPSFLAVAAQESCDKGMRRVAIQSLTRLVSAERLATEALYGSALRQVIKLCCADENRKHALSQVLTFLQDAVKRAQKENPEAGLQRKVEDTEWLLGTAWNVGTEAGKMKDFEIASAAFSVVSEIADLLPKTSSLMEIQRVANILAASTYIETVKKNPDSPEALKNALRCAQAAKVLIQQSKEVKAREIIQEQPGNSLKRKAERLDGDRPFLLALLDAAKAAELGLTSQWKAGRTNTATSELDRSLCTVSLLLIEIKSRLNDNSLLQDMQTASNIPAVDPMLFEMMASTLIETNCRVKEASVQALRHCLSCHLSASLSDYQHMARIYRHLVEATTAAQNREATARLFQEAISILKGSGVKHYPLIEVEWLIVHAWGNGEAMNRLGKMQQAEKWLSTALQLLCFHPEMASRHRSQMADAYAEVLERCSADQQSAFDIAG